MMRLWVMGVAALASLPAGWAAAWLARRWSRGGLAAWQVTLLTSAAFLWAAVAVPPTWVLAASLLLAWALVTLAVTDLLVLRLPDALTLPLILAGLASSVALPGRPVLDHLIGAAVGYGFLTLLAAAFARLTGREGMGQGDAKLLAAAGAWLGWRALASVVLLACGATLAWLLVMTVLRGPRVLRRRIAFGAPLCLGLWLTWLYGPLA